MKIGIVAGLAVAGLALAGCSSTSSGGSGQAAETSRTTAGTTAATSAGTSASTGASVEAAGDTSSPTVSSGGSNASGKPVALLLAKLKLSDNGGNSFGADMPEAEPGWTAAVSVTMSDGSALKAVPNGTTVLNLAALVDEAAKTQDLDSLRKLCRSGCDQLATLMPAKDAGGRTGYQRLSQLLEKTHPAPGYTNSWSVDYPGFSANQHGAATALDQRDMTLLGVTKRYTGLQTGFENTNDGMVPAYGWDATLDQNR